MLQNLAKVAMNLGEVKMSKKKIKKKIKKKMQYNMELIKGSNEVNRFFYIGFPQEPSTPN